MVYMTMRRCRAFAAEKGIPHFVPKPLWWGAHPSFVGMQWVEGVRLTDQLANPPQGVTGVTVGEPHTLTALGRAMASFHDAFAEDPESIEEAGDVRMSDPRRPSSRLVQTLTGRSIGNWPLLVRSLGDIRTNNILIDHAGAIWLIDTPAELKLTPPEWDLARLCLRARLAATNASEGGPRPSLATGDELCRLIVGGYQEMSRLLASSSYSLSSLHPFLSAEALKRARKAVRQRRLREARAEVYFGVVYGLRGLGERRRS